MQEYTNCHRNGGGKDKDKPKSGNIKETSLFSPETDPQGMYTGVPRNPYDAPIQDADDL